jgi:hypothetical protein
MASPAKTRPPQRTPSRALTEKSVNEIRSLSARPDAGWTTKSLARIFDTTEIAISAVLNRTGPYQEDAGSPGQR